MTCYGLVLEKRRNFVSSSPKCIDSLLSMNHSQNIENSLVEATLIIIMNVCLDGKSTYHDDKDNSHFRIMIEGDH